MSYYVSRVCKNPNHVDKIWNNIKIKVLLHLKTISKDITIILNEEKTIVTGYDCNNIKVRFYTSFITDESTDDNILLITNSANKTNITSIFNIPVNFYNIIQ